MPFVRGETRIRNHGCAKDVLSVEEVTWRYQEDPTEIIDVPDDVAGHYRQRATDPNPTTSKSLNSSRTNEFPTRKSRGDLVLKNRINR